MSYIYAFLMIFFCVWSSNPLFANPNPKTIVTIISKENNGDFPRMIEHMLKNKSETPIEVRYIDYAKVRSKEQLCQVCLNANLIVTIGFESTRATLALHPKRPVLGTLVYKSTFDELIEEFQHNADQDHQPNASAIYLDQPFERYMSLIHNTVPNPKEIKPVGVILSEHTHRLRKSLEAEAALQHIPLSIVEIRSGDNPLQALQMLLRDSHTILAIPDTLIFNERTAKPILMMTLQANVPVIGYSKAYVDLGALVGLYTEPEQIAMQTVDKILSTLRQQQTTLTPPEFAKNYKVAINDEMSRKFGFPKQGLSAIMRSMNGVE